MKKLKRIKYISLTVFLIALFAVSFPFILSVFKSTYLPNQEKVVRVSNSKAVPLYLIIDLKKYKDFEIKVYGSNGEEIRPRGQGKQALSDEVPKGYHYSYFSTDASNISKLKIEIRNKQNGLIFTHISLWLQQGEGWLPA